MTDAEKFVREKMPHVCTGGPMKNGKSHPDGGYLLFAAPWCSGPFSSGRTLIEAWAVAANRIERESGPSPTGEKGAEK